MAESEKPALLRKLRPQHVRFAQLVAQGMSQADAYRGAYPHSMAWQQTAVYSKAAQLAARPGVAAHIAELRAAAAEKAVMTAADVLREAMRLARFDVRKLYRPDGSPKPIHELDDETAAAIQAVEVHDEYVGTGKARKWVGYTKRYRVADKNAALDKLFRHFGLYEKDNLQTGNPLRQLAEALSGKVMGVVPDVEPDASVVLGVGGARGFGDDEEDVNG